MCDNVIMYVKKEVGIFNLFSYYGGSKWKKNEKYAIYVEALGSGCHGRKRQKEKQSFQLRINNNNNNECHTSSYSTSFLLSYVLCKIFDVGKSIEFLPIFIYQYIGTWCCNFKARLQERDLCIYLNAKSGMNK